MNDDCKKAKTGENYKYIILVIYILCNIENAFINFTFSPIIKSLKFAYDVSDFAIYYFSVSYSIFYLIMNFPANYIIEHKGIKPSLLIFSSLQILCCFCRLFINSSIAYVYIGQTIAAIACPFCNNIISKISMKWFQPQNRMISTSFMASSFMFGTGLAFILSIFFVKDPIENPDISSQKNEVFNYLLSSFFLTVAVFFVVSIFFKEKPENSCCFVAEHPRETSLESLKLVIKNKNFIFLCCGFSLQTSNFCLFVVYIHFILSPFGLDETQIAYLGSLVNFACFVGKIVIGFLVNRIFSFKTALFYICLSLLLATFGLLMSLISGSFGLTLIFACFFGFFLQMYWSPSYEFACELIFPVGEANANGGLIFCGCFMNVIFGFIFSRIYGLNQNLWAPFSFAYFFISTGISLKLFQRIEEVLHREKMEFELKEQSVNSNYKIPFLNKII